MLEKCYPDIIYDSIYEIDTDALKNKGITGLLFDIDNTLVKPDIKQPDVRLVKWLASLKEQGFKLCILSNAGKKRVRAFSKGLDIHAINNAGKPSKKGFLKAMGILGLTSREICMIGDQLFTDVLGAKRLGIYSVFTKPIVLFEVFTVMLKRPFEALVFMLNNRSQKIS
jgi:HAD superfamily phosphatase (TIGR01668 family)